MRGKGSTTTSSLASSSSSIMLRLLIVRMTFLWCGTSINSHIGKNHAPKLVLQAHVRLLLSHLGGGALSTRGPLVIKCGERE